MTIMRTPVFCGYSVVYFGRQAQNFQGTSIQREDYYTSTHKTEAAHFPGMLVTIHQAAYRHKPSKLQNVKYELGLNTQTI